MGAPECLFCSHVNTANSKFCSQCGSPLHLMPCAQCGTINNLTARSCRSCGRKFPARPHIGSPAVDRAAVPGRATLKPQGETSPLADADEAGSVLLRRESAVALTSSPLAARKRATRRRSAVIMGAVAFVGLGIAGTYLYRQHAMDQERDLNSADAEWRRSGTVGYRGAIGKQDPDTVGSTVPAAVAGGTVSPALISPVEKAAASPVPIPPGEKAAASPVPTDRMGGQVDSLLRDNPAKTIAPPGNEIAPAAPATAAVQGTPDKRASARKAADSTAPAATVPIFPPIARPTPTEAITRLERQPSRLGPCTESIASLGLCTLEPKQCAK
jgi:hypothetical protein